MRKEWTNDMALTYLLVDPETAVPILEECLEQGNLLKDEIEEEYRNITRQSEAATLVGSKISTWNQQVTSWTNQCLQRLSRVFIYKSKQFSFRDAPTSALYATGVNTEYQNVTKQLQARISRLEEFISFIFQHTSIQIIAARDNNVQIGGMSNVQEVKNEG